MAATSATAASQVSEPPKLPAEEVGAADGDAAAQHCCRWTVAAGLVGRARAVSASL